MEIMSLGFVEPGECGVRAKNEHPSDMPPMFVPMSKIVDAESIAQAAAPHSRGRRLAS